MSIQSPEAHQPELLEQIRHAIRHTHQADHCRLCGDEVSQLDRRRRLAHYERTEDTGELRMYHLCSRCAASPNDTGICSSCGRYDLAVEFFAPTLTLCPACLAVKRGQLPGTAIEGEDALW